MKKNIKSSLEPEWTVYEPHFKNLKARHEDDPKNGWGMMSDEKDSLIEENGGKVTVEYGHGGNCTLYGAKTGDVISTFTTIKEMQDFKKNHNLTIVKNSRRNNMIESSKETLYEDDGGRFYTWSELKADIDDFVKTSDFKDQFEGDEDMFEYFEKDHKTPNYYKIYMDFWDISSNGAMSEVEGTEEQWNEYNEQHGITSAKGNDMEKNIKSSVEDVYYNRDFSQYDDARKYAEKLANKLKDITIIEDIFETKLDYYIDGKFNHSTDIFSEKENYDNLITIKYHNGLFSVSYKGSKIKSSKENNMKKTIKSDIDWESAKHAFDDKKYLIYKTGINDEWEEFPFYGTDNVFTADEYERKGYKVEKNNMIKSSYGRYNVDNDIYAVYVDDELVEYVANTSIPGYEYISMNEYGDIAYRNSFRPTWFEKFKKKYGTTNDIEEQSNVRMYGQKVLDAIEKSLKYDEYEKDMNENGTAYEFKGSDGKWHPVDPGTSAMAMCRTSNIPVRPVTSARKPIKSSKWVEDVADKKGITFDQVLEVFKDNGYGEDEADDFWNSKWNDVSDAFGEDGISGLDELFGIEITSSCKPINSSPNFFYDEDRIPNEMKKEFYKRIYYYNEDDAIVSHDHTYESSKGMTFAYAKRLAKKLALENDCDSATIEDYDGDGVNFKFGGVKNNMKIQSKRLIKSGTSNFVSNDGNFPLVVYIAENYIYDEETDSDTEERDYDADQWEYEDAASNAESLAENMNIYLSEAGYRRGLNGREDYSAPYNVGITSGYYEGIQIQIEDNGSFDPEYMAQDDYDYTHDDSFYDLPQEEQDRLTSETEEKLIKEQEDKINNFLNELCTGYGWIKLGVSARFSNGETMYTRIDNSRKPVTSGLTFRQAVQDFKAAGQWNDYYEMQQDWEAYKDGLERDGVISEKTRSTWGNPCTPEGFKKWNK